MTKSDAQQKTLGSIMPFRFTKGNLRDIDPFWFREVFFDNLNWQVIDRLDGRRIEQAHVRPHVIVQDEDFGRVNMRVDYDPERVQNKNAPTVHLHYPNRLRFHLADNDTTGCKVVMTRQYNGSFLFEILNP